MNTIQVEIDKKNCFTGRAYSTTKLFQNERHLDNYLRKMSKNESRTKIIGHRILSNG